MRRSASRWLSISAVVTVLAGAAPALGEQLLPGQRLVPGTSIWSGNKRALFTLQSDGNLVLYHQVGNRLVPVWTASTSGPGVFAILQSDGNLVVYRGQKPLWSSGTSGKGGVRLVVQDDGNLVLYNARRAAIWSTSTSLNGAVAGSPAVRKAPSASAMRPGRVFFARRNAPRPLVRRATSGLTSRPVAGSFGRLAAASPATPAPARTSSAAHWEGRRGKGPLWCFRLIVEAPSWRTIWVGKANSRDDVLRKIEKVSQASRRAGRTADGCRRPSDGHATRCGPWRMHGAGNQYWFELHPSFRDHWGATQRADSYYALRYANDVVVHASTARLNVANEGPGRLIYSRGVAWCN